MSNQLNIVVPDQMDERLEEVKKKTGLSKSEIGRRGLLNQIDELEGGSK